MKIQIRSNVFETNSSSVHSMVMCSGSEYDKWAAGETYLDMCNDVFVPVDEINKKMLEDYDKHLTNNKIDINEEGFNKEEDFEEYKREWLRESDCYSFEGFMEDNYYDYEIFMDEYTTPISKERVVAFGYYGHD